MATAFKLFSMSMLHDLIAVCDQPFADRDSAEAAKKMMETHKYWAGREIAVLPVVVPDSAVTVQVHQK